MVGFLASDLVGLSLGFIPNADQIVLIFGNSLSTIDKLKENGVQILS